MRSSAAHQAKRSHAGNAAEAIVEAHNAALAAAGAAWLYRVPTPIALVREGGRLRAIHKARATVDYLGHHADGRVIAVEVKHLAKTKGDPSLPLSRVEPHQAAALDRVECAGGIARLVVVYAGGERLYAVPWLDARALGPSVKLERYLVPVNRLYLF